MNGDLRVVVLFGLVAGADPQADGKGAEFSPCHPIREEILENNRELGGEGDDQNCVAGDG